MGSFMLCWKRFSWLFLFCLCCIASPVLAEGIEIRSAELVPVDDSWQLNADFDIGFTAEQEEAVNKGVALNFLIEFELMEPRRYWFDEEVASATLRVRLSYHVLSRQYLLNIGTHQKAFSSFQEAREELGNLHNWPVLEKSQIKKGEPYYALLRMRLDPTRLPKALQVDALAPEKWKLVSERHRWTPVLFAPTPVVEVPVTPAK